MQAVGAGHRTVRESCDLLEAQHPVVHVAEHDAPAGRAEVDRRDDAAALIEETPNRSLSVSKRRSAGAPFGKLRDRWPSGGHRRKAAATPESTGMCRPVVRLSSGPVSTYTASATFSGTTSRLRIVRFA